VVLTHVRTIGDHGSPVVFLHGLFGQGRNWTQIGKTLAGEHRVTLVDLPHHGRSPSSESFEYEDVVAQVAQLLSSDDPVALVGHSLGGKVAMLLTLLHPDLVERLCVVDMSPVDYEKSPAGGLARYAQALLALDLDAIDSREDADRALAAEVDEPTVRAFLLQNLRRDGDGWRWQANLEVLERDMEEIAEWPDELVADAAPYEGPVLWLAGGRSDYVTDDYVPAMSRWFPKVRRVTVKQAGHWVHSEEPEIVIEALQRFLAPAPAK
jgi:pimeloyl-ACP methyl ester carboxylesterase